MTGNSPRPRPRDIERFNAEVAKIAERDGISLEEAAENFGNLLVNIEDNAETIYTLRIAFEELEARVTALEAG